MVHSPFDHFAGLIEPAHRGRFLFVVLILGAQVSVRSAYPSDQEPYRFTLIAQPELIQVEDNPTFAENAGFVSPATSKRSALKFLYRDSGVTPSNVGRPMHVVQGTVEHSLNKRWLISVSGFYAEEKQNGMGYFRLDAGSNYGVEAGIGAEWEGIQGDLSYAYAVDEITRAETTGGETKHVGKLRFFLPVVREILFAGLELQTTSSRIAQAGNEAKEYAVMNTILFAHRFARGLEVSAIIYNLFDSRNTGIGMNWQDMVYQDARTYRLKFSYRF